MARNRLFNMRMSEEEWLRVNFIAEHYGLDMAGAIRMVMKREEADIKRGEASAALAQLRTPKA